MLDIMRSRLGTDDPSEFKDQIVVISEYLDKNGNVVGSSVLANSHSIYVKYDVRRVTSGGDLGDSIYGIVYENLYSNVIRLDTDDLSRINVVVSNLVSDGIDVLNFEVSGEIGFNLTSELFYRMCSAYPIVNIKVGSNVVIGLPKTQISINSLFIDGGYLSFPNSFKLSCTKNLEIRNVSIINNLDGIPYIELSGKNTVLDNWSSNIVYKLAVVATLQDDNDSFRTTTAELNRFTFNLDNVKNSEVPNGVYEDPLIYLGSVYEASISGASLFGGAYRKFIKLDGITHLSITDLYRSSDIVAAYTIGYQSVKSLDIGNITVKGTTKNSYLTYVIFPDPSKCIMTDELTVSDFSVENVALIDADNLGTALIDISDGTAECFEFASFLNNNSTKIILRNLTLALREDFKIEGNTIEFNNVKITWLLPGGIQIEGRDDIRIYDSRIVSEKEDFHIKINENCSLTVKDSIIQCKDFKVYNDDDKTDETTQVISDISNRVILFENTSMSAYGAIELMNGIRLKMKEFTLINADSFYSEIESVDLCPFILQTEGKAIPITFASAVFRDSEIDDTEDSQNSTMTLNSCSGKISYIDKETSAADSRNTKNLNLNLDGCKVVFATYSDYMIFRTKVNSKGSQGSCIVGCDPRSFITPDIKSDDLADFSIVGSIEKNSKYVNYGSVNLTD